MAIQEYSPVKMSLSDLKFDDTNANEMSDEQMAGLEKSFMRFGITDDILIDQNNLIIAGNHRAKKLVELGVKETFVKQRHFKNDAERKMCAQVMNKLHGTYNKEKEANELLQIFKGKKLNELADILATKKETLEAILSQYHGIEFNKNGEEPQIGMQQTTNKCPQCGYEW